jgi:SPP1 family predicted phage head-tail adaptor
MVITIDSLITLIEDGLPPVEIFAEIKSMYASESNSARQRNYKREFCFIVYAEEYEDQSEIEYCGETYTIYRRYLRKDRRIELYAEGRRGNLNGN